MNEFGTVALIVVGAVISMTTTILADTLRERRASAAQHRERRLVFEREMLGEVRHPLFEMHRLFAEMCSELKIAERLADRWLPPSEAYGAVARDARNRGREATVELLFTRFQENMGELEGRRQFLLDNDLRNGINELRGTVKNFLGATSKAEADAASQAFGTKFSEVIDRVGERTRSLYI